MMYWPCRIATLAIRYNSKTFVPVKAVTTADGTDFFLKEKPIRAFKIYEDYSSAGMKAAPEQIIVEIYDVSKIGAFGTSRFNKTFMGNNRVREVQFTNERVGKEIGLSDTAFTGITAVKSYEVVGKNGATPVYLYVMQTPKHMICFARTMRGTSREFDLDPAVIVTQMRVNNAGNSVGNIQLPRSDASSRHYKCCNACRQQIDPTKNGSSTRYYFGQCDYLSGPPVQWAFR